MSDFNEDYIYYSPEGEKLKLLYTLDDFLNHEHSRNILLKDWENEFRKTIEEPVLKKVESIKIQQFNLGTNFFKNCKGGEFESDLIYLLSKHIKPKYNLEYFYNNPDEAKFLNSS